MLYSILSMHLLKIIQLMYIGLWAYSASLILSRSHFRYCNIEYFMSQHCRDSEDFSDSAIVAVTLRIAVLIVTAV